jgi:hypothetical protein
MCRLFIIYLGMLPGCLSAPIAPSDPTKSSTTISLDLGLGDSNEVTKQDAGGRSPFGDRRWNQKDAGRGLKDDGGALKDGEGALKDGEGALKDGKSNPPQAAESGVPSPSGNTLSCAEVKSCQSTQCRSTDPGCSEQCLQRGTLEAQQHYQALHQCVPAASARCLNGSEGCRDASCLCLDQACQKEMLLCGMMYDCKESLLCQNDCPPADKDCQARCIVKMNYYGYYTWMNYMVCIGEGLKNPSRCQTQCQGPLGQEDPQCRSCLFNSCNKWVTACGINAP